MEEIKILIIIIAMPVVMFWGFVLLVITTRFIAEVFIMLPIEILLALFPKKETPIDIQKPTNPPKPKIIPPSNKN